jgi:hypothetical protein
VSAPKPEGSLAEHDLADIVQALHEQHWTGTLTVTNRGVGRSMVVQEGRLVWASSSDPDDRLGELLLRRGRLTLAQYLAAGRAIGPGKRLGTILVEQGVLAPRDLVRSVIEHTQEIIYGAFLWTEGHYRLQEGPGSSEVITLKMSTPDIIMEGIRRIESWIRIDRAIGGAAARYARAPGAEDVARSMTLAPEKLGLLASLNEATVEQLCAMSAGAGGLSDFEVCRTLWAFKVIGLVRRTDAVQRPKAALEEDEGLDMVLAEGDEP